MSLPSLLTRLLLAALLGPVALEASAFAQGLPGAQRVALPGTGGVVELWEDVEPDGSSIRRYAVRPAGRAWGRPRDVSPLLRLRYASFDPRVAEPSVPPQLRSGQDDELLVVQFVTRPLQPYLAALRSLGAQPQVFLADQGWIVRMDPDLAEDVRALPFVRWVGAMHPAFKLEEPILAALRSGRWLSPRRYSVMLFERGPAAQARVAATIGGLGGRVHGTTPRGFRLEATLSLAQVVGVARLPEVMFLDRKGPMAPDMDVVREIGGASFLHATLGLTGDGVRGEMMDTELDLTHPEWKHTPLVHLPGGDITHGTRVFGTLFSQGLNPKSRGLLPDGQGFYAYRTPLLGGGPTRYQHTAELVDPTGPWRAVFQTVSTGDPLSTQYTTISAEMDDILLLYDILITQSQSNDGTPQSRPQAWAKNIVAVGGIKHWDTLDRSDDAWDSYASTGPAADGRVKPDLAHFCDKVFTTEVGGGYSATGGAGTSIATPIVAGHAGLIQQMWHEGLFAGFGGGASVFDDRPHMTTAKALLINSAYRYDWTQGGPNGDIDRFKQGWGMPDLRRLYDARARTVIVDESDLLQPLGLQQYSLPVTQKDIELRVTLVYADPRGNPASTVHRINDLSLRVIDPLGVSYWGNVGLAAGNWSVPGGASNTIDTVENVFVRDPQPGLWTIEVIADEVNEDSHLETPALDADFALVIAAQEGPTTLDLLWDNGPLVSNPGQGAGGADASVRASLSLGEQAMGYGHDVASDTRVADDFLVVGDEWRVREFEVFAYQIGAGAGNPTVTSVNLRVWDGPPGAPTSRILYGDDVTNRMSAAAWDQLYRVDEPSLTSTNRAVYRITCTVPWWPLPAGRYWLDWQTDGSLSGGPYLPPISIPGQTHPAGANALQSTAGSWSPIQDPGSLTPDDFKFVVRGLRAGTVEDLLDPTKG